MNDTIILVVTALVSGLIATLVTLWWQGVCVKREEKLNIFKTLMSKRYDIASKESVEALNLIDVVFYSSTKVRNAWKEFNDATNLPEGQAKSQIISDKHLRLLEEMAEDIKYKSISWENIKQYYYPVGLSDKNQQETLLRTVQIDAALAQIEKSKKNDNTAQANTNEQMAAQVLMEAMKNPAAIDSLIKLMDKTNSVNKNNRQKR